MQVTCIHCGMEAVVTPEFHLCRHCQGDLAALVTPEFKADYYFQKASELAEQGAFLVSLEQIQQGLRAQDRPDLHLLAAIIYADLGREAQLRMHIGAIPTDDILRPEAEALLHQLVKRRATAPATPAVAPRAGDAPSGSRAPAAGPRLIASALTAMVVLGSVALLSRMQDLDVSVWRDWFERGGAAQRELAAATPVPRGAASAPATGQAGDRAPAQPPLPGTAAETAVQVLTPERNRTEEQWRRQVTQNVMDLIHEETIDFTRILAERGFPELRSSEIIGVVQGRQLVLMGTVDSPEAKQAALDAANQLRGVGDVDAYGLRVVLPERSHVIRAGDTLWSLAAEYLGASSRWQEIVALNPELQSNRLLRAGQEIRIPPQQLAETEP